MSGDEHHHPVDDEIPRGGDEIPHDGDENAHRSAEDEPHSEPASFSTSDDAWDNNKNKENEDELVFTKTQITLRPNCDESVVIVDKGTRVRVVAKLGRDALLVFSEEHKQFGTCFPEQLDLGNGTPSLSDDPIELRRGSREEHGVGRDKIDAPKQINSTPMVSIRQKRKDPDSTMVQPSARRRDRRLALGGASSVRLRQKMNRLERTVLNVMDCMNMPRRDNAETEVDEPENPFLKCLAGKKLSTIESVESSGTDSDADVSDDKLSLGKTYVPPSTSYFRYDKKSPTTRIADRETESALKFVRAYPDRIPKYSAHTVLPLALFLCRVVYNFAIQTGLHDVGILSKWIYHCFPGDNQEKILYFLGLVRKSQPGVSLFTTLRELARKLSPDDFMSLSNLQRRSNEEGLTDLVIRLISDIPIVLDCTVTEIPALVAQFVKNSEQSSAIGTEFRRELIRNKSPLTRETLIKIACRVDRLIKPSPKNIAALTNQTAQICGICSDEHTHRRDDGSMWPTCEECFYAFDSRPRPPSKNDLYRNKTYAAPRQPAFNPRNRSTRCLDCQVETVTNPRTGRPYSRCQGCFLKNRNIFTNNNQYARSGVRRRPPGRDSFESSRSNAWRRPSFRKNIHEFKAYAPFNPKCYRMAMKVSNSDKSKAVTGLFDTGCNTEVISRKACQELGISHMIRPRKDHATGVDGKALSIVGSVTADVWIGKLKYTGDFSVIDRMANYDCMVGTSFMKKSGMLDQIFEAAKDKLGEDNVRKGN